MASDLDLTAAIAKAVTYIAGSDAQTLAASAVTAAAPLIEAAVREQAAQELIAFAETFGRENAAQATLRRHIHMCARRIGPKMTDQEVVEALQRGDFVACHLDDAGRAIPPGETTEAGAKAVNHE